MIAKFLRPSANFNGVFYNTDKVGADKAELMAAVNFDVLQGLNEIRPSDYLHHLQAVSARNKDISQPQLHVAISTNGREHDKHELTAAAVTWMEKMGYGKQPYLILFHKDTENNHVHIVSTRVGPEGRKINSGFERVRSVQAINQIMGIDQDSSAQKDLEKAMSYRFSTLPQFKLILEKQGYTIKENDLIKFGKKLTVIDDEKIRLRDPDQHRAVQLKAIFKKYAPRDDLRSFIEYLKTKLGVELVFHARDGKPAYGYTVIDHAQKNVYKGSGIMPLKELMPVFGSTNSLQETSSTISPQTYIDFKQVPQKTTQQIIPQKTDRPFTVNISKDVDDDQIHGPRRRRKKKARTNTR